MLVPGIADVRMELSFWIFLAATLLSLALGNYATHGWRTDGRVDERHAVQYMQGDFDDGTSHPILGAYTANTLYVEDTHSTRKNGSFFGLLDPRSPRRFRPIAAGIGLVLVAAPLALTLCFDTVTYKMSGPAAAITGTSRPFSMYNLIAKTPPALWAATFATGYIAPTLFAAGFARTRILAAWCTVDVMLVACLAGLLQLRQFTTFVLGDQFAGFITIDAELEWPIYCIGVAALVVLIMIAWSVWLRQNAAKG
jgi:hypothetical protein